jgi:hypothetical protein
MAVGEDRFLAVVVVGRTLKRHDVWTFDGRDLAAGDGTIAGNWNYGPGLRCRCVCSPVERNCVLHSIDTDFARFPSLKWENPIRLG